ncbi:uncharacterized protein [Nicotiana tomentosiformis]|uniref:uncharacterized protein n=1 Tax=Nicotiana tomentosiformis TaxID=4098 RepID=UPI00388CC6AF
MEDSKEIDTPIATATKLDINEPSSYVDKNLYRGMMGSLLYLTSSRHDIIFSVGLCARFQANTKESHLTVVKRILIYLKGTTDLYLWYPKDLHKRILSEEPSSSRLHVAAKGKKKVSEPVEVVEIEEMDMVLHDENKAEEVEVMTPKAKKIKTSKKKSPLKNVDAEPSTLSKITMFARKSRKVQIVEEEECEVEEESDEEQDRMVKFGKRTILIFEG